MRGGANSDFCRQSGLRDMPIHSQIVWMVRTQRRTYSLKGQLVPTSLDCRIMEECWLRKSVLWGGGFSLFCIEN